MVLTGGRGDGGRRAGMPWRPRGLPAGEVRHSLRRRNDAKCTAVIRSAPTSSVRVTQRKGDAGISNVIRGLRARNEGGCLIDARHPNTEGESSSCRSSIGQSQIDSSGPADAVVPATLPSSAAFTSLARPYAFTSSTRVVIEV